MLKAEVLGDSLSAMLLFSRPLLFFNKLENTSGLGRWRNFQPIVWSFEFVHMSFDCVFHIVR